MCEVEGRTLVLSDDWVITCVCVCVCGGGGIRVLSHIDNNIVNTVIFGICNLEFWRLVISIRNRQVYY